MKPIIVDMKEMSDSVEVYNSRPNPFLAIFIYIILAIISASVIWMVFSKIDIVVKGDGTFKGEISASEVSSGITGKVIENYVTDGQYVKEGDVLYLLDILSLSDTISNYREQMQEVENRLAILEAYEKSLDGDISLLSSYTDNPYYTEITNRRSLLFASIDAGKGNSDGQVALYESNVNSISDVINKYNEKIQKLENAKEDIIARNNTFELNEGYYYSMVNGYISSYIYTEKQYDNRISEYLASEGEAGQTVENMREEKAQILSNMEKEQITAVEQQIENLNNTVMSMELNLASAKMQLESVKNTGNNKSEDIAILTEKGNIAAEILNYQEKKEQCERYLKSYDIQNDNCIVKANASGYFYEEQHLSTGTYIKEGFSLGKIYPEKQSDYYAYVYVKNSDIAGVTIEQRVKLEVPAYPSNEYGYFTGKVCDVAKDITVDTSTGCAYYLVKIQCDRKIQKNTKGESVSLMNGMSCQAKIITGKENVLKYLLKKIDLID